MNLGGIGTYKTKYTYTLENDSDSEAKVKIEAALTYEAPGDKKGLPFSIKNATLKSSEGKGDATFNKKAGRIESSKIEMTIKGDLDIEISGMNTKVDLNQTQVSTVKTTDNDPLPAPSKKS